MLGGQAAGRTPRPALSRPLPGPRGVSTFTTFCPLSFAARKPPATSSLGGDSSVSAIRQSAIRT